MTQPMIAESESMRKVAALMDRAAPTDASVLIWGEVNGDREFVARKIHEMSRRAQGPWITINWAAMPAFVEHPELFGAVADDGSRRPGLLERASGGTLFLEEIASLTVASQAELLRVLQAGRFRPAGADHDVELDVRLIAGCYNPEREMAAGELLRELYERLSEVSLELPPLRWRREDIPGLAEQFLLEAWGLTDRSDQPPPRLAPDAVQALVDNPWPGGLRQLDTIIHYITWTAAPGHVITAAEVPDAP